MHTITLLVGDLDEDRLPVQIVPNDGLETHLILTALRVAETQVIGQLIQDAEARGREQLKGEENEQAPDTEGAGA